MALLPQLRCNEAHCIRRWESSRKWESIERMCAENFSSGEARRCFPTCPECVHNWGAYPWAWGTGVYHNSPEKEYFFAFSILKKCASVSDTIFEIYGVRKYVKISFSLLSTNRGKTKSAIHSHSDPRWGSYETWSRLSFGEKAMSRRCTHNFRSKLTLTENTIGQRRGYEGAV